MSDKPTADEPIPAKPKSKKLLLIVIGVVLILALAAGGGWFYLSRQHAAALDGEEEVVKVEPKGPPTYLPMDNMIVNLADPGGEKVAQVGVTLELVDIKAIDKVRLYLPAIRSDIILLVSQRTSEELLQREGKEKLAADIWLEAARHFDDGSASSEKSKKESAKSGKAASDKKKLEDGLIRGVLFSSFIVQ